jgi:hypothetical protein
LQEGFATKTGLLGQPGNQCFGIDFPDQDSVRLKPLNTDAEEVMIEPVAANRVYFIRKPFLILPSQSGNERIKQTK